MAQNESQNKDQNKGILADNSSTYSEEGVDLTLIRWMLSMTPAERLQVLQQNVRSILRLRNGSSDA